jgi:hypothetical protein
MRTVEDGEGDRYVLLKESASSSLVRDPGTGETQHLPTADLEAVDAPPLETLAAALPDERRDHLDAVRDERTLGLLCWLHDRGPVPVRDLLADTTLCESDLHGMVGELRAAGLVREADVAGERGYALTDEGTARLATLRA